MITAKKAFKFTFLLGVIAASLVAISQRQAILDWWKLRGYDPPAAIAALATGDAMTDSARRMFYVNHPSLVTQITTLRQSCTISEQTIVLGCYHPGQNGIYIFDVTNAELDGVEQVTAAHEMLHAAYERLSPKDKNYIDRLLKDYFNNILSDERIVNTIELYRANQPETLINEMHSIFGTEIASLPSELESYYSRYFSDRSKVVGFSANYESEFSSRLDTINKYDSQLAELKQKITGSESTLTLQSAQLETERANLTYQSFGDIQAYNASVAAFNAQISAYNRGVAQLQSDIDAFNRLVAVRNGLAAELRSLQGAIDTRLTTQSAQ